MSTQEYAKETDGLDAVKVGDWIALDNGGGSLLRYKVTHVTPKQIHCLGTAYWKKNGEMVGATGYYRSTAYPMTEHRAQVIRKTELAARLGRTNWYAYPLETLEIVWNIIEEARKAKEAEANG